MANESIRTRSAGPLGPVVGDTGTRFRIYCTTTEDCSVRLFDESGSIAHTVRLEARGAGYFEAEVAGVGHGALYKYLLADRELPDPYARFLPQGVHGPAMVVDRRGASPSEGVYRPLREQVFYELHVGAFTDEGTYPAASERLPAIAELGATALELMPLSSYAGRRGWGYDGVAHFAPHAAYGTPDELAAFVARAHALGLSVFLDVVYNHFGPSGNYLAAFSPLYFTGRAGSLWGEGPDFAHPPMRRYLVDNALYWLSEFGFDGLRLDATHAIADPSPRHILRELADEVASLRPRRLLIAEDERNDPALVSGLGLDAVWADDFHHSVHVTLTGERDGYYAGYPPGAEAIAETIGNGWLYRGQVYPSTGKPRGREAGPLSAEAFVYCVQNHDQVGNRALGERLNHLVSQEAFLAASTVLLFLPMTPLLFMGQEWAASSPFQYFTDHEDELGRAVSLGRREEFQRFRAFSDPGARARIPDPQAEQTFLRSKLRWDERTRGAHARALDLYRSLIALRRSDRVLRASSRAELEASAEGSLLRIERRLGAETRRLFVNFGTESIAWSRLTAASPIPLLLRSDREAPLGTGLPPFSAAILTG